MNELSASESTARVLIETVERLSTATSLERVTQVVTEAVRRALGCDGATFVLRDDDSCHYVDEHAISPLWKGGRFPLTACVSGWAMLNRQAVVIPDIYADDRIPHDAYRPTFVHSLVMAPIRSADPIGALGAYWAEHHDADAEEVRLLGIIANSAAVALDNLELRGIVLRRVAERDDLARRADELEEAIYTVAHDLRSPLGAILGYAELLDDIVVASPAIDETGKARVFAGTIVESGQRMARQIDVMLGLYRITSRPIEPAPVDLSAVARRVADDLSARTGRRQIDISIEDGLRVVADPTLTHLMLENLLGNAVKYTGKKDHAHIELAAVVAGVGAGVGATRVDRVEPLATFVVRDNGDGFAPEEAERLFQPLTRLHSDDDFPGTGLGLASVARIVEMHGGAVRAEGEKSVGAAFYFSLPTAV
ncbi:sensor histidine kinase [Nocardioides plantarum]|uniref:Sensor-like histidine kinase SenX3 n=1 Tax=Nocardioides plantarum TaxID=29299 RepID=A0ABV5KD08_9ACTN|nr:ATP-binding protein [Nocardioides plantarum]